MQMPSPDLDTPLKDRELGGLGIHLMRALMDQVTYRREEPKNVLTMSKRIR
jgi:anti-sigma regulatory factor (Ser/Thr protein kinase)